MDNVATWTINMTQMLAALSNAMDCVEGELAGVSLHHAKRVACLCAALGRGLGLDESSLFDLSACALLHDNALPEYIATEYRPDIGVEMGAHCVYGEANMKRFPLFGDVKHALLYHHENADGTGPFGKRSDEIPQYARLIHLADMLDVTFDLGDAATRAQEVQSFVSEHIGTLFDAQCADLFLQYGDIDGLLKSLSGDRLSETVQSSLPQVRRSLASGQLADFAMLFATIIDYKSAFTARHSQSVAEKVMRMADYYGMVEPERMQLFLAGALHDIGKVLIHNDILEKPGRLTSDEFCEMQTHPYATWEILRGIDGLSEVAHWAANHHEKLDGSGYPFGLTASALDRNDRLMACVDIYQAMIEERPYKPGFSHDEAMGELRRLADRRLLDVGIVEDIAIALA